MPHFAGTINPLKAFEATGSLGAARKRSKFGQPVPDAPKLARERADWAFSVPVTLVWGLLLLMRQA